MKRSTNDDDDDDVCRSPQERPLVSERSGEPQMMDKGNAQKLTTTDALTYLDKVKDIFRDSKEKYHEFLEVMNDFKRQRIDTAGVVARMKELLKGHNELILGFNVFLPKGYEITLEGEDEQHHNEKHLDLEEAILFVNKIKRRFKGQGHVYQCYLDTMNKYTKGKKSIKELHKEVCALLNDQPDLLKEFKNLFNHNPGCGGRSSPAVTIQSEKKTVAECKASVEQTDPDDEKGCIMGDKRHGEKEKDTD